MFRMPALVAVARHAIARLRVAELFHKLAAIEGDIDDGERRIEDLDDAEILRRLLAYEPVFDDVRRLREQLVDSGSSLTISARRTT